MGPAQARLDGVSGETDLSACWGPGGTDCLGCGELEGARAAVGNGQAPPFPLPVRIARTQRAQQPGLRRRCGLNDLDAAQSEAIQFLLYRRLSQWPTRQAPFEAPGPLLARFCYACCARRRRRLVSAQPDLPLTIQSIKTLKKGPLTQSRSISLKQTRLGTGKRTGT